MVVLFFVNQVVYVYENDSKIVLNFFLVIYIYNQGQLYVSMWKRYFILMKGL